MSCIWAYGRFVMASLVHPTMGEVLLWLLLGGLIIIGLAVFFRLHRGLRRLHRAARRFAAGDLSRRIDVRSPAPVAQLAQTLNRMASQLDERLQTVISQRNELEAVLSSMVEGVLAIDRQENVISLNRAAANLLDIDADRAVGRSIQEAVRNAALQQFVAATLASPGSTERDLVLRVSADETGDSTERFLQAQGAVLRDATGQRIGALIVLHDVTRLRRLEMVRRDFVANVSHEIKTPLTAIKGAVETLLDEQSHDPQLNQQFLGIVQRQADRLHAIVEDLLSLARIEQETERARVSLQRNALEPVIIAAIEACHHKAIAKRITLTQDLDAQLEARINGPLLEQALVNLLDNAIKYSPEGSAVHVTAATHADEMIISVTDDGVGIEADHLPRLFERFYRPDRARSRAMGGTGLGLSIVKHIANAHRGRVSVSSKPGEGSTFRIHLPAISREQPGGAD